MDPNATLEKIRQLTQELYTDDCDAMFVGQQIADAFQDLDAWLSKGGFLPTAWSDGRAFRTVLDGVIAGSRWDAS
jgi:hypothetical protein